jgi:hypothetical protein
MSSLRRLLEVHPDGMREIFHWDEPTRTFAIEYQQDVGRVLTAAREESADTGGWSPSRELHHVASVPPLAQLAMVKRYGPEILKDIRLMRRVLDDPEWRYLRIGKVI